NNEDGFGLVDGCELVLPGWDPFDGRYDWGVEVTEYSESVLPKSGRAEIGHRGGDFRLEWFSAGGDVGIVRLFPGVEPH
ncbi:MAG: hypothetical protein ACQKBT_02160, partial [Puniceicoccales bacterium]